jgi:hypothetical protein
LVAQPKETPQFLLLVLGRLSTLAAARHQNMAAAANRSPRFRFGTQDHLCANDQERPSVLNPTRK